jgi:hypothetical protein
LPVREKACFGPVAQLGARLNGIQEVRGSIPLRSTSLKSQKAKISENQNCFGFLAFLAF